jgi:hypothetical protein
MKNLLKTGLLAIVISVSVAACGDGDKGGKTTKPEIDSPQNKIDTMKKTGIDSVKKDSVKK